MNLSDITSAGLCRILLRFAIAARNTIDTTSWRHDTVISTAVSPVQPIANARHCVAIYHDDSHQKSIVTNQ